MPVTAYGFNELGVVSSCLYLIAKALDVSLYGFRFRDEFPSPGIVEQIFAGNHLAGVVHQAAEQLEFARGKINSALIALGDVRVFVQGNAACRNLVGRLCGFNALATAQKGTLAFACPKSSRTPKGFAR